MDIKEEFKGKEDQSAAKDVEAAQLLVTRNIFSSQWEDSDVVFVVEETKFHVHRVLLSLMSPVFKAMFNSSFREKGQTEIPLPGKEANVFLSFLLIVYSKEDFNEITMTNVIDLLALGHEYLVERVEKDCQKFLMHSDPDDSQVVLNALLVTQRAPEPDDFQTWCHKKLCCLKIDDLEKMEGYENLNATSLKSILVPRLKGLQTCLEEVFPQFMGLLDFTVHLLGTDERSYPKIVTCHQHYPNGVSSGFRSGAVGIRDCLVCKKMFQSIVGKTGQHTGFGYRWHYGGEYHFDKHIVKVACKVMEILGKP